MFSKFLKGKVTSLSSVFFLLSIIVSCSAEGLVRLSELDWSPVPVGSGSEPLTPLPAVSSRAGLAWPVLSVLVGRTRHLLVRRARLSLSAALWPACPAPGARVLSSGRGGH